MTFGCTVSRQHGPNLILLGPLFILGGLMYKDAWNKPIEFEAPKEFEGYQYWGLVVVNGELEFRKDYFIDEREK